MNRTHAEEYLDNHSYDTGVKWEMTFDIISVLDTCQRLRRKLSVLNRRLQRTRTENKRLQKYNESLLKFISDYMVH